jgi:tRNA pseudouridine38-40 synthase
MVFTVVSPEARESADLVKVTRMVLVMEYNGTRYYGFQLQDSLPTIQGEIEKALSKLTGERVRVTASSRTDAGVHARAQVVSFRTRSALAPEVFINGLNHYLPKDIAVKVAHRVGDSFRVRRGAVSREYDYSILNSSTRSPIREGFAYRVAGHLDIEAMGRACQALIGEHDFASFASNIGSEVKSTVREVYRAGVNRDGDLVIFNIVANAFLRHQVRSTAGALVRIGQGKMSEEEFTGILEARQPGLAGPILPACGLCLMQVNYPRSFEEK